MEDGASTFIHGHFTIRAIHHVIADNVDEPEWGHEKVPTMTWDDMKFNNNGNIVSQERSQKSKKKRLSFLEVDHHLTLSSHEPLTIILEVLGARSMPLRRPRVQSEGLLQL